ncbi:MDR family MFS transporter [Virgibacillus kekensis]|uniref:MDR family MFS transporter n=1 Tax=Virgibacillus kekensis TaxID=202261 RepID=A0ABV9DLK6_9BACI
MKRLTLKIKTAYIQLPGVVWALLAANLVFVTTRFMVMPFMAIYFSDKFNMTPAEVGILIGISPLSSMLFSIWGGRLGDKIGVHRIFPFALIIPAISLIGYVASSNYYVIGVCAAIAGVGWAIFNSSSNAILSLETPEEHIEKVFSYSYWGTNLGGVIGPLIGVSILGAGTSGYPILLFSAVLIGIAVTMASVFKAKGKNSPAQKTTEEQDGTHPKESVFRQLIKNGVLVWMTISYFLIFFTEAQQDSNIAQFFSDSFENGVQLFGILLSMIMTIIVVMQPVVAQFIDRVNVKLILAIGCVLDITGYTILIFNHTVWVWFMSFAIITVGELIMVPKMQGIIAKAAPDHLKATYFSVVSMGGNSAYMLGPWIGGILLTFGSIESLLTLLVIVSATQLFTLLLGSRAHGRRKHGQINENTLNGTH